MSLSSSWQPFLHLGSRVVQSHRYWSCGGRPNLGAGMLKRWVSALLKCIWLEQMPKSAHKCRTTLSRYNGCNLYLLTATTFPLVSKPFMRAFLLLSIVQRELLAKIRWILCMGLQLSREHRFTVWLNFQEYVRIECTRNSSVRIRRRPLRMTGYHDVRCFPNICPDICAYSRCLTHLSATETCTNQKHFKHRDFAPGHESQNL